MYSQEFVWQPKRRYRTLVELATAKGSFDRLVAGFAYATTGGARVVDEALTSGIPNYDSLTKRWLVGIDWCRTEPKAIDVLTARKQTKVRVPAGKATVQKRGCVPAVPWHPKVLVLAGREDIAVVAGSGNLSHNGQLKGYEVGVVTAVSKPASAEERAVARNCRSLLAWLESEWSSATPYSTIAALYQEQFAEASTGINNSTDDDTLPDGLSRTVTPERLQALRTSPRLWIQAGKLHANRGEGVPGNQLMLSPQTRVFFGIPASSVDTDTALGSVALSYRGKVRWDCPLRFSNNSMDVLTLPLPGKEGPQTYDGKVLCFTFSGRKRGSAVWDLRLGTKTEAASWKTRSRARETYYQMGGPNKREWGLLD